MKYFLVYKLTLFHQKGTEKEKQMLINYLSKHQDIHKDLLNKSIEKRTEIVGKSD